MTAKRHFRIGAASLAALVACGGPGATAQAQSVAFIEQIGQYSRTTIDQSNTATSSASARFDGSENLAEMVQSGTANSAVVTISGNRNGQANAGAGGGRSMVFGSQQLTVVKSAKDLIGSPGTGNPCGNGNGNGAGNPCNGNGGNAGSTGNAGSAKATTLLTPLVLEAGVISQDGQRNQVGVSLLGDNNDFHASQKGNDNRGAQAVAGSFNQVALVQGTPGGASGNANAAVQVQRGSGNASYVQQTGDLNTARAVQAGSVGVTEASAISAVDGVAALLGQAGSTNYGASAEAALMNLASKGEGVGNTIALQQNGDNNAALLGQFGNNNSIGLRQPGDAYASVTQIGNGHAIAIDQQAGTHGVTPITIVQR